MLGESKAMQRVRELVARAAPGNATVLVRGERGSGKELVARAIHEGSSRRGGPFARVHCAGIPAGALEGELFGEERADSSGFLPARPGRLELARGGTLFLDEIGELSRATQGKLLRLLQERSYERLGGGDAVVAEVRVVAATEVDLEGMVDRGELREDLFYLLSVVPIWLPPLRARRDDIELLASAFCRSAAASSGRPELALDASALALLRAQRWPGNVAQLENLVGRLVALGAGPAITASEVSSELAGHVRFETENEASKGVGASLPGLSPAPEAGAPARDTPLPGEPVALSSREVEVLRLVAAGRSNKEIAAELFIAVTTVQRHVANIYEKTGARGRADATRFALGRGLTATR